MSSGLALSVTSILNAVVECLTTCMALGNKVVISYHTIKMKNLDVTDMGEVVSSEEVDEDLY